MLLCMGRSGFLYLRQQSRRTLVRADLKPKGVFHMKKIFKVSGTIAMLAILLISFAACGDILGSPNKNNQPTDTYTPVVYKSYGMDGTKYELTITRTGKAVLQFTPAAGDSYTLIITTTAGTTKTSTGQITDVSDKIFTLKHTGTNVTFSVIVNANSSSGGTIDSFTDDIPINNSATKAPAPSELTTNQTPVAGDYDIGNLTQSVSSVTAVTITPKSGKSSGKITIYYAGTSGTTYTKSKTLPDEKGTYAVTFDVAASTGWNEAKGLTAGDLVINTNQTPKADDYDIGNMTQLVNSVTAVTIKAKADKSPGAVSNIKYAGSATLPQAAGTYAVTFDVAAATGWNAATGLSAGNLVVSTTKPLSVTIFGTRVVGNYLSADVVKSSSEQTKYQWLRNDNPIPGQEGPQYMLDLDDASQRVSVKVTCADKSDTSPPVPIQPLEYSISQSQDWLFVCYKHGESWLPTWWNWNNRFDIQWMRGNDKIPDETGPYYYLQPGDGGKEIKARVTYNSITRDSLEIAFRVPPKALEGTWKAEHDDISRDGYWYDRDDESNYGNYLCTGSFTLWFITDSIFRMKQYYVGKETGEGYTYSSEGVGTYELSGSTVKLSDEVSGTLTENNTKLDLPYSSYVLKFTK